MARKRRIPSDMQHRITRRARRNTPKICEVKIPGVHDDMAAIELHHRRMWARGGNHTYANLIAACSKCHDWIHGRGNRRKAIELGLLLVFHPRRYWRRAEQLHLLEKLNERD